MSNEKDLMGYDPLEWLKEDSENTEPEEVTAEAEADEAVPEPEAEAVTETTEQAETVVSEESVAAAPEDVTEEPAMQAPEGDAVVDLQNSLQIMDVALLKPKLEKSLAELKVITLRADEDIAVDGAGLQLLLAFVQQAQQEGITLQWEALPLPIVEAARLLDTKQVLLLE